ncbi:MAG: ABC transporter permease [Gammaproteobacteria bacterium]|nr:ABC transporter permease [Gammaproteobacteria bacterium]
MNQTPQNIWRYRDLFFNLVRKEVKVRYMGALLGFLWSFGNPLIFTLVYYFVFTYVFPSGQPNFALFVLTGILHWSLFAQSISQASESLTSNGDLIKKVNFPRILVPLSNFGVNVVFWVVAMMIYCVSYVPLGGKIPFHTLWLYPVIVTLYFALIIGLSLLLSVMYVSLRDIKHLVEIGLQVLFWASAILYEPRMLSEKVQHVVMLNPLSWYMSSMRDVLFYGLYPSITIMLAITALSFSVLGAGLWVYKTRVPYLVDKL